MDLTPGPEVEITAEMIEVYQRAYTRYLLSEAATDETVDRHVAEIMPLVEDRTRVAIAAVAPLIHKAAYRAGREDAARDLGVTCQDNGDLIFIVGLEPTPWTHLHECVRERDHRSKLHRCKCGVEWRVSDQPRTPLAEVSGDTSSGTEVERADG